MAVFDESKVINALHKDKAEIGKKYWVSDNIVDLKKNGLQKKQLEQLRFSKWFVPIIHSVMSSWMKMMRVGNIFTHMKNHRSRE